MKMTIECKVPERHTIMSRSPASHSVEKNEHVSFAVVGLTPHLLPCNTEFYIHVAKDGHGAMCFQGIDLEGKQLVATNSLQLTFNSMFKLYRNITLVESNFSRTKSITFDF